MPSTRKYLLQITKATFLIACLFISIFLNNTWADVRQASEDAAKLKSFVESGIAYIKTVGPKKAYAEFDKPNGKFNKDGMYLFAYDYNGKCLAHGSTPSRIGKNFIQERDKYDTPVAKMLIELAKAGGGYFSYYWPAPKTGNIQYKTSYIKATDNSSLIGSGLYEVMDVPKSQPIRLAELKSFVNSGIEYFKNNGAQKAYEEFSNPKGKFRNGESYIYVIDQKGVMLAHGANKENIGKNFYNAKDEFDTPYIQLLIQAAKSGEGMVSYYRPEPVHNKVKLKISYIKPLTNDTFIVSGIYED